MARQKKILAPKPCKLPTCGIVFQPTRAWQEFHTPECRIAWHKGVTRCPGCGKVFNREES